LPDPIQQTFGLFLLEKGMVKKREKHEEEHEEKREIASSNKGLARGKEKKK
jgi:hypothetical protein